MHRSRGVSREFADLGRAHPVPAGRPAGRGLDELVRRRLVGVVDPVGCRSCGPRSASCQVFLRGLQEGHARGLLAPLRLGRSHHVRALAEAVGPQLQGLLQAPVFLGRWGGVWQRERQAFLLDHGDRASPSPGPDHPRITSGGAGVWDGERCKGKAVRAWPAAPGPTLQAGSLGGPSRVYFQALRGVTWVRLALPCWPLSEQSE